MKYRQKLGIISIVRHVIYAVLTIVKSGEFLISNATIFPKIPLKTLERLIISSLNDRKAEQVSSLNLVGKSDFADLMIIASGTSQRHVSSLADAVVDALKKAGYEHIPVEGKDVGDWVLVDAGDVIVHLFKPEIRDHYNLEKMWSMPSLKPVAAEN